MPTVYNEQGADVNWLHATDIFDKNGAYKNAKWMAAFEGKPKMVDGKIEAADIAQGRLGK